MGKEWDDQQIIDWQTRVFACVVVLMVGLMLFLRTLARPGTSYLLEIEAGKHNRAGIATLVALGAIQTLEANNL